MQTTNTNNVNPVRADNNTTFTDRKANLAQGLGIFSLVAATLFGVYKTGVTAAAGHDLHTAAVSNKLDEEVAAQVMRAGDKLQSQAIQWGFFSVGATAAAITLVARAAYNEIDREFQK